ncbi:hypothetical protein [Burkholderia sp. AU33545]|nr:hypothetical protein [Burkholderia sp. AU33545]
MSVFDSEISENQVRVSMNLSSQKSTLSGGHLKIGGGVIVKKCNG